LHDHNAGAWIFRGAKGDARWPNGSKASLTVERFDANGVIIRREDTTDSRTAGESAVYYGTVHGERMEGTALIKDLRADGTMENKQVPWFATIPTTTCDSNLSADEAVEFGGEAAAFRQMPSAFQCFLLAANQGNGRAKALVGLMYRDGIGVKTNYTESMVWLKAAAIQGDHDAQLALHQAYDLGIGTNPDPAQAAKWQHAADSNPLVVRQAKMDAEQREDKQLMFMGLTSILSAAVSGPTVIVR
jgi:hypothetical protein